MAAKTKKVERPVRRPERKIGPFHNGLGIAIWLNTVETDKGTRFFRSISIAPRRYRDPQSGDWKDATSFQPIDLSTLILALQEARNFIASTPLPGQAVEEEELAEIHADEGTTAEGQPPF